MSASILPPRRRPRPEVILLEALAAWLLAAGPACRPASPDVLPAPPARAEGAAVRVDVDWASFLADHDLLWTRLPEAYGERPFLGNGQLGSMIYRAGDEIRVPLGRTDVQDHRDDASGWAAYSRPRFLLGELALRPAGRIRGGQLRLDLWNAEVRGEIVTDKGTIRLAQFIPTEEMGVVTVLRATGGEADCRWAWIPGEARTTRPGVPVTPAEIEAYATRYGGQHAATLKSYIPNPPVRHAEAGPVRIAAQDLLAGGGYAVAWTETAGGDGSRVLYVGTGNSYPDRAAADDAAAVVKRLAGRRLDDVAAAHRAWWHAYYPQSFVALPDARWESFYWIQMYKLACATRSGRTMMDTSGPWNVATPWPYITWDLNVQLCYWPAVASNRLELGRSLVETLSRNRSALIDNVRPPEWASDSAYLPIATAQDLIGPRDGDMRYFKCVGDLPWALHDAWLMYRATMDDRLLREDIYPLLRRSVGLYLHLLEEGADGRLHLPETYSPEYGAAPDCNFDLALLRWACGALLEAERRLALRDPLVPRWRDVLARLAPYAEDATDGFLVGRGVPLARGHRHYSHLLMIYPLYLVNADTPGAAARIEASVRHWADRPEERMGYTFTGASSMMAALGRGAEALAYLQGLNPFIEPNTMYLETSPTLETPLSAAQCLHDMLLQSWGGGLDDPAGAWRPVLRVFPAVPPAWADVRFHDLRADGAFLVSAERAAGRTRWVRIRSLAGEPCRIRPALEGEIAVRAARPMSLKPLGNGAYELDLRKGEEAVLYAVREPTAVRIARLPRAPAERNPFGLRDDGRAKRGGGRPKTPAGASTGAEQ